MCRFLIYRGSDEILLSQLLLDPTHSILRQSFDSRLRLDHRRGNTNADGYGCGWYTDPKLGAEPCLFKSTTPVWNCSNLPRIASKTASKLVFGHVRATTEGSLSEDNCHPFSHGSLMWMHNGGLGGWKYIKRRLGERLHDKWYLLVQGGTDSEWAFALFLDSLERLGYDPSSQPKNGFGPNILRKALLQTIEIINELTSAIPESTIQAENVDTRSLLNFVISDGHSVICTRYVSSKTDEAASLYFSSGTQWETPPAALKNDGDYHMERRDKGARIVLVASEPLTFEREKWVNVPTNSVLTIHGQTVMVHPINDGFSERDPYHKRSSAFAHTKGLMTNEKAARPSPVPTPGSESDSQRSFPVSMIPNGSGRSRTPETAPSVAAATANTRGRKPLATIEHQAAIANSRAYEPPSSPDVWHNAKITAEQVNTKKKRRSLNAGEAPHPAEWADAEQAEHDRSESPVHSPTRGSDLATSEKAARILGIGAY